MYISVSFWPLSCPSNYHTLTYQIRKINSRSGKTLSFLDFSSTGVLRSGDGPLTRAPSPEEDRREFEQATLEGTSPAHSLDGPLAFQATQVPLKRVG